MHLRLAFCLPLLLASPALAQHRVMLQGNDKLVVLDRDGKIEWEMPWGPIHDIHLLPNGNVLVQQGANKIAEIDRNAKKVVWSYDSATSNGNAGKTVEVHSFQPLEDGELMIAESGPGRIIVINREGKLLSETKLRMDRPHPHMDTRLVRKTADGNYLVCHEGDGKVKEYNPDENSISWVYEVPLFGKTRADGHGPEAFGNKCFCGELRLKSGNLLISTGNGHSVLEITPQREIVWKLEQRDLPGIVLAWVTTLEVLPNGNYVIGNCHAGPGQPSLVEIEPKTKKVVWQLDAHDRFGDNVSNSLLLDVEGDVIR